MATLSITIPDEQAQRVFVALIATFPGFDLLAETKAEFVKRVLVRYILSLVQEHEARLAQRAAEAKVAAEVSVS